MGAAMGAGDGAAGFGALAEGAAEEAASSNNNNNNMSNSSRNISNRSIF
jgi:hypothetical protein